MKKLLYNIIALCLLLVANACSNSESNTADAIKRQKALTESFLPKSVGAAQELLIVMDPIAWNNELGEAVREVFDRPMRGLVRKQAFFNVTFIKASEFKGSFRQYRKVLMVAGFDHKTKDNSMMTRHFSKKGMKEMFKSNEIFFVERSDLFAKGQFVGILGHKKTKHLVQELKNNGEYYRNKFVKKTLDYIRSAKLPSPNDKVIESLRKKHAFSMAIPSTYQLAKDEVNGEKGFVCFREPHQAYDKYICISYEPYLSETVFEDVLSHRDSIYKTHFFMDPEDKETYIKTVTKQMKAWDLERQFKGFFSVESRGFWESNAGAMMGGPYVGYTFVDETNNRLYHLEGLAFAPTKKKRDIVNEMDAILWSFSH